MAITPSSNLKILQGVPIDKDYNHTLYFSSKANQQTYFSGKAKYTFNDFTYIRDNKAIRVNKKADNLYDCNYIMYQNENYSTKWFYAFITGVEYVNDNMSLIYFEQDYIQSWLLDCTLKSCFIEREHSVSDGLFEHIDDEGLDCGSEYVVEHKETYSMNQFNLAIIGAKYDEDQITIESKITSKVYNCLSVEHGYHVDAEHLVSISNAINDYVQSGRESAIIAIYQYPRVFEPSSSSPSDVVVNTKQFTANLSTFVEKGVSYTPKNKKLFCAPYNQLLVSNNSGDTAVYKWENWRTGTGYAPVGIFAISGCFMSKPCAICAPVDYLGVNQNWDYGLVFDNFPQCAWVGDTYKAWLAQNTGQIVANMANTANEALVSGITSGASALAGGMMFGNVQGGILNAAVQIVNSGIRGFNNEISLISSFLGKRHDLEHTPPTVYGQSRAPMLNVGLNRTQFDFYQQHIKLDYAKQIDDYFTRYGYICKKVKVPNISSRPHWNFTKTVGCAITGDIPPYAHSAICQIFDNGITFWKNASEVGNYSLDNSPS